MDSAVMRFLDERRLLASFVRPSAWNNSAPTRRNFKNFEISLFFENLSRKVSFYSKLKRMTSTLHKYITHL